MLCLLFRFSIASALNAGKKPGLFLRGHLKTCPKCHRFYQASKEVNGRLSRETPHLHRAYQSHLTQNIVAQLPPSPPSLAPVSSTPAGYLFPASAAALVLLLLGGWYFLSQQEPAKSPPTRDLAQISLYDMFSVAAVMPSEVVDEDVLAEWPNWVETPVTLEVKYLAQDAQTATNFLLACLDAKTLL